MPYRDLIAKYIKNMLAEMDTGQKREKVMKEAKKRAAIQVDAQTESWLDEVISGHK